MKKRIVPRVPPGDAERQVFDGAVKENLEVLCGQRGGRIEKLSLSGLTGNDLMFAEKINEIIARLM